MAPTVSLEYVGLQKSTTISQASSVVIMGKARKFPKAQSLAFVSDYPQAIETMAESEGFGSSGRVDAEMTASEDSYGPKRKSVNLNVDSYDRFGVPFQVFSLSNLLPSEKKNLGKRFKSELERVKLLQKKIASVHANDIPFSLSSDIHSYNEGHIRQPLEHFRMSAEVSTSQGKKRGFPGKNGSRTKQPSMGRGASKQGTACNTSNAMLMKQCENLLNKLMTHQHGWVFNAPVDVVELNIPDYFNVIKHPMDLGTIKGKLLSGEYSSPLGFAADVRLTFSNAKTYNPAGNDVHIMADILSKFFETRWKPIEKKVPVVIDAPAPSTSSIYVEPRTYTPMPPVKKKKTIPSENKAEHEPVKRAIPVVDKQKLSLELEDLLAELPDNIIDFLKKQSDNATQTDEDEIEIDIDTLSDDTLLALRKLLDDYLLDKEKKQGRAEPCEMELHNESGFSNSSVQPPQGNELVDEDVDIGGNDPPITSYPPVQIEKEEAVLRPDKHSSSSSSSGSSSSDSDSGGSSGSESDDEKAPGAAISTKEVLGSEVDTGQKTKDMRDSDQQNNLFSGSSQVELNSEPKEETSVVVESHQEGESAPLGRQVSPDKLYRAALLRSRFADTILKAQEKTLDKGEKLDPEKLRLEKEELERRRREEKARLQAEVKAAEEARRKAEADAAAEAKRRRDLEREAARLALQKMEKTVDINENCHFLEDLEMLRGEAAERLDSLIDEASPDLSQNNMGSFKFQGNSNPLEQLGLYMKMDDEEDEEVEPQRARGPDEATNEKDEEAKPQRASVPDDAANENSDENIHDPDNKIRNGTEDGEID